LACAPLRRERVPASKAKYAQSIVVDPKLSVVGRRRKSFVHSGSSRLMKFRVLLSALSVCLTTLYNKALDGDTKSAQLYLKATNRMVPPSVTISSNKKATELTDAELDSLIAAMAEREKASRSQLKVVV
jgi:hypothetical protein